MSEFTKGPWEWYTSNSFTRLGTANSYCEIMYAVTYRDGCSGIEFRNEADKPLITAAPEMYEMLERISSGEGLLPSQTIEALLSKARGDV